MSVEVSRDYGFQPATDQTAVTASGEKRRLDEQAEKCHGQRYQNRGFSRLYPQEQ